VPSVCVFLSSSAGSAPDIAAVEELGRELARRDLTLVYGGASVGLMGRLADATIAAGGHVIGVIPQVLVDREVAHDELGAQHIVDTMHQRKQRMYDLADAFVVAPGGYGTLEEAFEVITALQIGIHHKPCVFLDVDGFWEPMVTFLDHAVERGVLKADNRKLFRTAPTPAAALDALAAW